MKLTLESSNELVKMDGVPCRVWTGKTDKGIEVFAFIHRVAVRSDANCEEFEKDLKEEQPPLSATKKHELRHII